MGYSSWGHIMLGCSVVSNSLLWLNGSLSSYPIFILTCLYALQVKATLTAVNWFRMVSFKHSVPVFPKAHKICWFLSWKIWILEVDLNPWIELNQDTSRVKWGMVYNALSRSLMDCFIDQTASSKIRLCGKARLGALHPRLREWNSMGAGIRRIWKFAGTSSWGGRLMW